MYVQTALDDSSYQFPHINTEPIVGLIFVQCCHESMKF